MRSGVGVGLLALALYAASVPAGLGPGHDSAELTTAAWSLGVAHPPGYPLYVRLAHLWGELLPWGDYAWRINLFSAAMVALAAAGVADLIESATGSRPAAWLAGLGFAGLRTVWNQALVAEVFGLHLALLVGLAWSGQRALGGNRRWLWLFYALLGLCLAHHHTFVLALPGLLLMAPPRQWKSLLWTPAWLLTIAVAALCYADMLVRSQGQPALNWGEPDTWPALRDHFLRRAYGTFRLTARVESFELGVAHSLGYVLFTFVRQALWPWMALACWGGWRGWRVQRSLWALGLTWTVTFGPFFALIGRQRPGDFALDLLERFFASSYLGLALLAGLGFAECGRRWPRSRWLAAPLLIWLVWGNREICRLDRRELASSYGREALASCPPGALLFAHGDLPVGILEYAQKVQGLRPDVELVCPGLLGAAWYRRQSSARLRGWLKETRESDQTELIHRLAERAHGQHIPVLFNQKLTFPGSWRGRGLLWEWYPPGPIADDRDLSRALLKQALLDTRELAPGLKGESRFWPRYLISTRLRGLRQLCGQVYQQDPRLALAGQSRVLELGGDRPLDYLNRGLLYLELGRPRAARRDLQEALQRRPDWELARKLLDRCPR